METKICKGCGRNQPLENYTKARKGFTREIVLSGKCKGCQYIQKREYYKKLTTRENGEKVISHTHLPKRSKLRQVGRSDSSKLKVEIQALLRALAIKRDKECVLKGKAGACSGPLQAEHLNSRRHSHTFGDMRNIVLLCQYHHIFWKPQNSRIYWEMIEQIIGPIRWKWFKIAEADHTAHKADWQLVKLSLENDLKM